MVAIISTSVTVGKKKDQVVLCLREVAEQKVQEKKHENSASHRHQLGDYQQKRRSSSCVCARSSGAEMW